MRPEVLLLFLLVFGLSAMSPMAVATDRTQDTAAVELVSVDLPSEMAPDEGYELSATIANHGETAVDVWVIYFWNDIEYTAFTLNLPTGTEQTEFVGQISISRLESDLAVSIESGREYDHRIAVYEQTGTHPTDRGELFDERTVTVSILGESGDGGDTDSLSTSQRTETTAFREEPVDDDGAPERGFLSNSGNDPPVISNVFNLTVLGFVASIVGLLYQLFEGR